jgi:LmbE family N-acetylglucosaminyl deacetylase
VAARPSKALHTKAVGTTLVVSPHLDDAVLSVGGSIAAWTRAGERVVIASVFTNGPPLDEVSPGMRKWADYPARRVEDAAACAAVGAEVRWLGQIERAFRRPYLTGLTMFRTPADRAGFATLPAVTAALDALVDLDPARIVVPLGIGNHTDHVEVLIAATDWALARGWRDRLWFYEDFYALSGTMRARHPIARRERFRTWRSPLLRARRLAVIMRAIALARRGPDVDTFLAPALQSATWHVTRSPIDEAAKLDAIARYPSQAIAFGGMAGIARAMRAYHALWDRAEPLWRVDT